MKAVYINRYGGNEVIEYGERPRPKPSFGQVVVQVHAVAVNPRDWLMREGRYVFRFLTPRFPVILGTDISGKVIEVGKGVKHFRPGDEVFGMQTPFGGMGGYAEYTAIDQSAIAKKPTNVSHEEAAAVGCAALTAHRALADIGRIEKSTNVVIIGGSGGVGSYAIQLAKAFGANVTAITSSNNTDFVKSLGADIVIDYKKENFIDLVREQDLVFDTIGRESLKRCSKLLNKNGRYITTIPNLSNIFQSLFSQTLRFLCGGRGQSSHTVLVRANGEALAQIGAMMSSGKVHSIIDTVYPLSEAARALEKSRSWRSRGKLILRVCES